MNRFKFTPETYEEIDKLCKDQMRAPRKEPNENIGWFIGNLEGLCDVYNKSFPRNITDHRARIEEIENRADKLMKDIKWLLSNSLIPQIDFDDTKNKKLIFHIESMKEIRVVIGSFYPQLKNFRALLGKASKLLSLRKPKHGRPKADPTKLVSAMAEAYKKHIGTPTGYKDGAFFGIVTIILEVLGLRSEDPSRSIKSAISSLK